MADDEESVGESEQPELDVVSADDLAVVAAKIRASASNWQPGEVLDLGPLRWRPHLFDPEQKAVLHVHGTERLRSFMSRRMKAAKEAGYRVVVAADLAFLWNSETLLILALIDAEVILTDEDLRVGPQLIVKLLAVRGVKVGPTARVAIAEYLWNSRRDGATNIARGRRFEALVTFLLSQIDDFEIFETNLRADTDELDVVVRIRRVEGQLWCESGVPFVLVEAKNYAVDPAPQKELSLLIIKLLTRRGRARIGLFISATGISKDADLQELKLAFTDYTIVTIGPEEIDAWIHADNVNEYLDRMVGGAMLR